MSGPTNSIAVGNTAYLNIMETRFLVAIRGVEDNKIWVSFPGDCYPVNGMGGRLEFHKPESLSAYNVQVLRYADGQDTGIILERSESAEHRTHRTAWRVPTDITSAVQLDENDFRFSAVMENISADGALIRAHPILPIRTPLRVAFPLDREHGNQVVSGRVCYAQESESMGAEPIQQYGIRFTEMSDETRRLLTLFLYHHVRKLYPKDVAAMYPRTRRKKQYALPNQETACYTEYTKEVHDMRILLLLVFSAALSGCLADVLVTTAVQGELQAKQASSAKHTLDKVKNDTARMELQRAIDAYYAEKGTYPESLNVLGFNPVPQRADGGNFGYNPITGAVLDSDEGPSPADYLLMEDIRRAINAYGTAAGYYPPTLDTLAETGYLPQVPRTENGLEFSYNNQDGAFSHPLDGSVTARAVPAQPRAGVGGGGPMGEAMNGIAMQEQLNSNSNAGANRAQSQGRVGSGRAVNTQNARQEKALQDLGL